MISAIAIFVLHVLWTILLGIFHYIRLDFPKFSGCFKIEKYQAILLQKIGRIIDFNNTFLSLFLERFFENIEHSLINVRKILFYLIIHYTINYNKFIKEHSNIFFFLLHRKFEIFLEIEGFRMFQCMLYKTFFKKFQLVCKTS